MKARFYQVSACQQIVWNTSPNPHHQISDVDYFNRLSKLSGTMAGGQARIDSFGTIRPRPVLRPVFDGGNFGKC